MGEGIDVRDGVRGSASSSGSVLVRSGGLRVVTVRLVGLALSFLGLTLVTASVALAVGDANHPEACPGGTEASPGFRSYLPDCRAYEMVSPPYTEGFNVKESGSLFTALATSSLGTGPVVFGESAFVGDSFGVFAGAENSNKPFGGQYVFTRGVSGWSTTSFNPPYSMFPDGLYKPIVSPDLLSSVWELGSALSSVSDLNFYLRDKSGAYTVIGPVAPPGTIESGPSNIPQFGVKPIKLGASEGLSHLIFASIDEREGEPFWPGDSTFMEVEEAFNSPSLYEYVGTHNKAPTMVGVSKAGKQISQCGTSLGGSVAPNGEILLGASRYNAVSASGGTVFFTAAQGGCEGFNPVTKAVEAGEGPPVNEIYARINGKETVEISEPSAQDCSECQEGTPARAIYTAASADGSKVLFTTTQKLLPADKDSTVDLYEYDFTAPEHHRIVQVSAGGIGDATPGTGAEVQGLTTISPDASHVYFVAKGVLTTDERAGCKAAFEAEKVAEGGRCHAQSGADNLYLYEPNPAVPGQYETVFVATLSPGDSADWAGFQSTTSRVNHVNVTPDGRFLLFESTADLTPDDTSTASQLFQYDAVTGSLVRVSKGQDGYSDNGNGSIAVGGEPGRPMQSADGAYVAFESTVPLTPLAAESAGFRSVYEYHKGNVHLISDGHDINSFAGAPGSSLVGISPSGNDIYFETGDPLVPSDTNTQIGIYDARIDGGFPSSLSGSVSGCSGDACQGSSSSSATVQAPASSGLSGAGNHVSPSPDTTPKKTTKKKTVRCAKGKKLHHGKCVRTKPGKSRASSRVKRASNDNRRVK